ncbi:phosphoadenosine phosphosulfate reductase family protein [uncultured Pseudomonas sp.]|uniref:phosphoadenosine phosphosulfate reductase family protein n=1 Tax=uncultured Pseudomonas sp. TaxID=114707 RepID=UPI00258CDA81|nr:phosphoadenosine phosphosulfate reductase family protein [uncultured Pseudomonas sp.]
MRAYHADGRTALSFSGGRTSAYMARQVQLANPGKDITYLFANTGKEREETLRFVQRCDEEWGLGVIWVEFRDSDAGFTLVDFETASREGEPFEAAIRKRRYLPNPVTRYCTVELKIRAMHRYLKSIGWADGDGEWDQMVGIRADEHRRVAKIRKRGTSTETPREHMRLPLADAGITLADIDSFWADQPFRLELPTVNGKTLLGNCDLCFLKGRQQTYSIIQSDLHSADWWARMETLVESGGRAVTFRKDRPSYAEMQAYARQQQVLFAHEVDDAIGCFCGD